MEQLVQDQKNVNDMLLVEIMSGKEQFQECQEQFQECQILLLEEKQKTKMLTSEVGSLKELLLQKNENADRSLMNSACRSPAIRLADSGECILGKKNVDTLSGQDAIPNEKCPTITPNEDWNQNRLTPECCKKTKDDSGDEISKNCSLCAFHMLLELLIGMNFIVDYQTKGTQFSVIHQMSGYNFTLSWLKDKDGGTFAYQVSSLGTIESIAHDWMKEDIVFSAAMFPVFFERLSQVVGNKLLKPATSLPLRR